MSRLSLLAPALLLAVAGLAQEEPATAPAELDGPLLTEDVGGLPGSPLLDATEVLAEATEAGGLLFLAPATATAVVDSYAATLAQYPNAEALVGDLELVSAQLASGAPDGAVVGEALVRLGEATVATAETAGDATYVTLGEALAEAGRKLGGGE